MFFYAKVVLDNLTHQGSQAELEAELEAELADELEMEYFPDGLASAYNYPFPFH